MYFREIRDPVIVLKLFDKFLSFVSILFSQNLNLKKHSGKSHALSYSTQPQCVDDNVYVLIYMMYSLVEQMAAFE